MTPSLRDLSFKGHTEALTEIVSQGPPGFGYWTQLYQYALHQSAPKILKRMDSTGYHGNYFDSLAKINTSRFMKYPNQTIPRWTADDAACIKWAFSIMDPEERSTYPYLENCCDPYTFNFFRSPKVIASIMQEYHRLIMSFLNMFKDAMTELNQSEEDYSMREFERLLMKANDIEKCLGTMAWKSHFFHWFIRTYLRRDLRQPKQEETTFSSDRYPSTFLEARMESARISCFPEQLIAWLRLVTSSGYYVGKVTQYHRKYRPLSIAYSFINYPATNADSEDLWDSLISTICINGEKAFDEEELMEAFTNSA